MQSKSKRKKRKKDIMLNKLGIWKGNAIKMPYNIISKWDGKWDINGHRFARNRCDLRFRREKENGKHGRTKW